MCQIWPFSSAQPTPQTPERPAQAQREKIGLGSCGSKLIQTARNMIRSNFNFNSVITCTGESRFDVHASLVSFGQERRPLFLSVRPVVASVAVSPLPLKNTPLRTRSRRPALATHSPGRHAALGIWHAHPNDANERRAEERNRSAEETKTQRAGRSSLSAAHSPTRPSLCSTPLAATQQTPQRRTTLIARIARLK